MKENFSLQSLIRPEMLVVFVTAAFATLFQIPVLAVSAQQETAPNSSKNSVDDLELPVNWQKGDQREYRITNHIAKPTIAGGVENATTYQDVNIKVVESDDQSLTVAWTMGPTRLKDPPAKSDHVSNEVNKIFDGFVMYIEIDKEGYSRGIKNWEEVATATEDVLRITSKALRGGGMPAAEVAKRIATARKTAGSREAVEYKMTRALQIMLTPLAGNYSKTPYVYTDELPSPKANAVMPTKAIYKLESLNKQQGVATISWQQRLDRERAKENEVERAKSLRQSKPDETDLPIFFIPADSDLKDDAIYAVEIDSGWPVKITSTRTSVINGQVLKNQTIIERLKHK